MLEEEQRRRGLSRAEQGDAAPSQDTLQRDLSSCQKGSWPPAALSKGKSERSTAESDDDEEPAGKAPETMTPKQYLPVVALAPKRRWMLPDGNINYYLMPAP